MKVEVQVVHALKNVAEKAGSWWQLKKVMVMWGDSAEYSASRKLQDGSRYDRTSAGGFRQETRNSSRFSKTLRNAVADGGMKSVRLVERCWGRLTKFFQPCPRW